MSRCTGPSARAIRSLSQGDPPARNCSSGEGRADSTGKEQRRQRTPAKNVRCEVECSTVRGLLFQAPLRKLDGEVSKKLAQKGKNSTNRRQRISISHCEIQTSETGSAFAVYPATLLHCGTLPTHRQTVVLNVAFYCSILPIYMNLYGAIWSYLPREFAHARRFGSL
jgi:hypothetical protein